MRIRAGATAPVRVAGRGVRLRWSPDSAWLFYVAGEGLCRLRITVGGPAADGGTVLRWRGEISGLAPLVIYPRENHSFTERARQIDVRERVRAWFTRWLRVT